MNGASPQSRQRQTRSRDPHPQPSLAWRKWRPPIKPRQITLATSKAPLPSAGNWGGGRFFPAWPGREGDASAGLCCDPGPESASLSLCRPPTHPLATSRGAGQKRGSPAPSARLIGREDPPPPNSASGSSRRDETDPALRAGAAAAGRKGGSLWERGGPGRGKDPCPKHRMAPL